MCCLLLFSDGSQNEDQVIYFSHGLKSALMFYVCTARDKLCCLKVFSVHGTNRLPLFGFPALC